MKKVRKKKCATHKVSSNKKPALSLKSKSSRSCCKSLLSVSACRGVMQAVAPVMPYSRAEATVGASLAATVEDPGEKIEETGACVIDEEEPTAKRCRKLRRRSERSTAAAESAALNTRLLELFSRRRTCSSCERTTA